MNKCNYFSVPVTLTFSMMRPAVIIEVECYAYADKVIIKSTYKHICLMCVFYYNVSGDVYQCISQFSKEFHKLLD